MLRLKNLTMAFCALLMVVLLFTPILQIGPILLPTALAQENCSAVTEIDGWGIYAKETPEGLAFLLPEPPEGKVYAAQPAYTGFCEIFGIVGNHQELPVRICLQGSGDVVVGLYATSDIFLNKTWSELPTEFVEGKGMCAQLPAFGDVALLAGITLPGTESAGEVTNTNILSDEEIEALREQIGDGRICTITTAHRVNFRLSPSMDGEIVNSVPVGTTLGAVAVQDGWWQLQWYYQMGWIDGQYVTADCLSEEELAAQAEAQAALQAAEAAAAAQAAAEAAAAEAAALPEATAVPAE